MRTNDSFPCVVIPCFYYLLPQQLLNTLPEMSVAASYKWNFFNVFLSLKTYLPVFISKKNVKKSIVD